MTIAKTTTNTFDVLAQINCSAHVEKKGRFTYLSWPFAFAELMKRFPDAEIDVREWAGFPAVAGPKGWMVSVSVTISGVKRTQWHPIIDANNRAILAPDVFQINTSIQRAAVKAIALHGLGLYIYAGEDLPDGMADADTPEPIPAPTAKQQDAAAGLASEIALAPDEDSLKKVALRISKASLPDALIADLRTKYAARKSALTTEPAAETAP